MQGRRQLSNNDWAEDRLLGYIKDARACFLALCPLRGSGGMPPPGNLDSLRWLLVQSES